MGDLTERKDPKISESKDLNSSGGSSDTEMSSREQKNPFLQDAVYETMLPRNIDNLRTFFSPSEKSGVNKYKSHSAMHQPSKKVPSDTLKAFREISYMKFKVISSEEESCCSKDSHVDSEDSDLFKEGYVFERKSQLVSKDKVNKKVKKWNTITSEQLKEVNKMYKPSRSKNKETFSAPLGLEANRKITACPPDDNSSASQSRLSGQLNTEDEMDICRNDEFMREVRRVLKSKKSSHTLEKRSLPEEYSRLIFRKTAFVRDWKRRTRPLALTEKGEPLTENTDTGAEGDNTSEPATGIFDQLSKMVLKNKIVKNSKSAQQRNEVLRRAKEKRCDGQEISDAEEKCDSNTKDEKTKNQCDTVKAFSNLPQAFSNQETFVNRSDVNEIKTEEFLDPPEAYDNKQRRLKKVESYLSSVSEVQSIIPALPEIRELTIEREKSLFDSLAGEFLKNMASGNERRNKITRNDKKLLTIIVKRFIDRGELGQLDELMNANLNENTLEVPPYENVSDREKFFLRKIMRKFIRRGMRDALEDFIAWIYYKIETKKNKQPEKQEDNAWDEKVVQGLVAAFKNSGKNPSMNKIVAQLLREHLKMYPDLNARQISAVKEIIQDLVIERFARMYLERAKTDVDENCEPHALAVNVKDEFGMKSGMEHVDVNGRIVGIQWKFASFEGDFEKPLETNSEHETEEDSFVAGSSPSINIDPKIPNRNVKAIKPDDTKFIKERLKDIVWHVQQTYQRQKAGKATRTCSLVKKRSVTMIRDPIQGGKSNAKGLERKSDFEEKRKQMREEHIKWLLEQKEMLKDAKKKEVSNIQSFTQALPKRLENMIARRNRSLKKFDLKKNSMKDRNNPTTALRKKLTN